MRTLTVAGAVALAAALLASAGLFTGAIAPAGGAGSTAPTPANPAALRTAGDGPVATDVTALPRALATHPMPPGTLLSVTVTLVPPQPTREAAFLDAVNDPTSPSYRHFLTHAEFVNEFSSSQAAAESVGAVLTAAGGRGIVISPDRVAVTATLSTRAIASLFGVQMVEFGSPGQPLQYTATGPVRLAAGLAGRVAAIDGLSSGGPARPTLDLASAPLGRWPPATGPNEFVLNASNHDQWFIGSDFTQAFGATRLFPGTGSVPNATFPTSVAIATLLAGGYNQSTGQNLPPWDPSVVAAYWNGTFPAAWPRPNVVGVPVTIGALTPPAPGSFGGLNDSTLDEFENSLDVEMAGSLAPGASVYNFYFAGSILAGPTPTSTIADDFAQSLSEALAYNYSPQRLAVVTGSFGLPDLNDSFWNAELAVAAGTGVSVLASSGDQGNAPDTLTGRQDGPWPVWPASAAFNATGVVAVGGVSLALGGVPTSIYNGTGLNLSYDASVAGVVSTSAWYDAPPGGEVAGTEGGVSSVYPEPWFQFHSAAESPIVNATLLEGASKLGRAEPDLALPANATIATVVADASGAIYFSVLSGTSVASPVLAGFLADVVAVESARTAAGWAPLGYLDPALYRIASYFAVHPSAANTPFLDVTAGRNYVFSAGVGWDPTTGWGVPIAPNFLAADENATIRSFQYGGPTPGLPPSSTTGPGVPWVYAMVLLAAVGAVALAAVVVFAGRSRSRGAPAVPPGAWGGGPSSFGPGVQGNVYPGATFLCPYCGTVRPAEPVRCPRCGAL